jgi:uncharacterized damage-inducible protein DinB
MERYMKIRLTVLAASVLNLFTFQTVLAQSFVQDSDLLLSSIEAEFTGINEPVLTAPVSALTGDVINDLNYYEGKITSLAEAMPEENYTWRPADGVRSIGEVYLHITFANYLFLKFFGHEMPEGITMDFEKSTTDKNEIVAHFKPSFEYAKSKISELTDDDLAKTYDFFGNKLTGSAMLLVYLNHAHEHLGQSIAYARMNGVTPPWSSGDN